MLRLKHVLQHTVGFSGSTVRHRSTGGLQFRRYDADLLIRGGTIVNHDRSFIGDVLVKNGKITDVLATSGHGLDVLEDQRNAKQVVNAAGKFVLPGLIDPHVHLEMPFMGTSSIDGYLAGSRAAMAGGTTTLIDFIIPKKQQDLVEAYEEWHARADGLPICDYGFHCAITYWDDELIPRGMERLVKEKGITSFKMFLAYKNMLMVNDEQVLKVLKKAKELGAICMVHAENGDLVEEGQFAVQDAGVFGPEGHYLSRNEEAEAEATHRAITLAAQINTPLYVVHVMSELAANEVARGRRKGFVVYGETLAAALGVDGQELYNEDWRHAAGFVMSPPLSPDPRTKLTLMKRVAAGELQCISTDNCTFSSHQKALGKDSFARIPNGINGIEDRSSIVWEKGVRAGYLSVNDFVNVTSTNAAKIFGLYPQKGCIGVGSDADIIVFDGDAKRTISASTHHHAVDFNIFEGMEVHGCVEKTISGGTVKYSKGDSNADIERFTGSGKFLFRDPFPEPFNRIKYLDETRNPARDKVNRPSERCKNNEPSQEKVEESLDDILLNSDHHQEIERIYYGGTPSAIDTMSHSGEKFEVAGYELLSKIPNRERRVVRVAAIQHSIVKPTTDPIQDQKYAIFDKVQELIELSAENGANIACLQELWYSPFFVCTREKYPWVEFAEDPRTGESTVLLSKLAKTHNMVLLSPILEKDEHGILHNACVVIDNRGNFLGLHRKNHIPRVGDFNESTYYMEGDTGHPVFDTDFGKIGISICYDRHIPLNWFKLAQNGAEIIFNPSATVDSLSEHLWGLEARTAAIANHCFTVAINRVGTEQYAHEFTSGDGKPAHNTFGHFYGSSYVTAPTGQRTPGLSRTRDGILLVDVDLNLCDETKQKWGFAMTSRLGELYTL